MRDRLVELLKQDPCPSTMWCDPNCQYAHLQNCFAERYADHLLENGVIVPPCKVGDRVYVITTKRPCHACVLCTDFCHQTCSFDDKNKLVTKIARVCGITTDGKHKVHLEIDKSKICSAYECTYWFQDFGKTVFLTKEEAEKALKERDGK